MPDNGKSSKKSKRTDLDFYHSPTQLRFDTWNQLEEYTSRLREKHLRKADVAAFTRRTHDAIALLEIIETYSAFPSQDDFNLLWQLYREEGFDVLARLVARIVRALTGGTYRSRHIDLRIATEHEVKEESTVSDDYNQQQRPYFEVLFVDESGVEDIRRLRERLQALRRPEDDFVYDIVVVPSFEDALIAVLFNYNIQAAVIRYGFPLRSMNHLEILQRYLATINEAEYEDALDIERGPLLGNLLSELRLVGKQVRVDVLALHALRSHHCHQRAVPKGLDQRVNNANVVGTQNRLCQRFGLLLVQGPYLRHLHESPTF